MPATKTYLALTMPPAPEDFNKLLAYATTGRYIVGWVDPSDEDIDEDPDIEPWPEYSEEPIDHPALDLLRVTAGAAVHIFPVEGSQAGSRTWYMTYPNEDALLTAAENGALYLPSSEYALEIKVA